MDAKQALQVIEQATNQATEKGVYNLKDVSIIIQALTILSEVVNVENAKPEKK
jgi:hypothetical protein